jgi:short-subunit dehydrogenase
VKSLRIKGKTVVLAGATGAIGRATCGALLSQGATVVAVGRDPVRLAQLQEDLQAPSGQLLVLPADLSRENPWPAVLEKTLAARRAVDIFIHAAGRIAPGAFLELTDSEIDSLVQVNFRSVVSAARVFLPHMAERRAGQFIVVGSLGGIVPMPFETMYASTKFALRGFCLSLREEMRSQGVTLSLISPGPVRSPLLDMEGSDPRAALTFVDAPVEPSTIARQILRLLVRRRGEVVHPALQRVEALLITTVPGLFGALYPFLTAIGRRRLRTYQRSDAEDPHEHAASIQAA